MQPSNRQWYLTFDWGRDRIKSTGISSEDIRIVLAEQNAAHFREQKKAHDAAQKISIAPLIMVTKTIVHISTFEALVSSATVASASPSVEVVEVLLKNNSTEQINPNSPAHNICNFPSRGDTILQPSPLGKKSGEKEHRELVQICCYEGCRNEATSKTGRGFCDLHQVESMANEQMKLGFEESGEGEQIQLNSSKGTISDMISEGGECNGNSAHDIDVSSNKLLGKRDVSSLTSTNKKKDTFVLDLSDVPKQSPILKPGIIKEGASKFKGVFFNKEKKKWTAQINIGGKLRYLGTYAKDEDAAIDYARAAFKYRKEGVMEESGIDKQCASSEMGEKQETKKKRQKLDTCTIDLSDVPPQSPILKIGKVTEGASKYKGICFNKKCKKWVAYIKIEGKQRHIGSYANQEDAAIDYARTVLKYKGEAALDKLRGQINHSSDSTEVLNRHDAKPMDVEQRKSDCAENEHDVEMQSNNSIGSIVVEEEALCDGQSMIHDDNDDFAGVVKMKCACPPEDPNIGGRDMNKKDECSDKFVIDLNGVPQQLPIPRSSNINEGDPKYMGAYYQKNNNTWMATIAIEGKQRYIGRYENEGDAAIDFARAVFKYRGQRALDKMRSIFTIDLSDVPPQLPIRKTDEQIKEGGSRYKGVYFNKLANKWVAIIIIGGKTRHVSCQDNEEDAAVDHARAVLKYKGRELSDTAMTTECLAVDLSDIGSQAPIPRNCNRNVDGMSRFRGVTYLKPANKWVTQITFDGIQRFIGSYDREEDAAADYARAVLKYKGQKVLDEMRANISSSSTSELLYDNEKDRGHADESFEI